MLSCHLKFGVQDEEKDRPNNMPGDQLDEGASDLEPTISGEVCYSAFFFLLVC